VRCVTIETEEQTKRALIVFVKAPISGDVKTRLIPYLTGAEAADLYKCFVMDVFRNISKVTKSIQVRVAYQPHSKAADLSWLGLKNPPELFKQEGRSLGERLIHAFGVAFGRGAQHVVIIGSDSPTLHPEYIDRAFDSLHDADVVLGPAHDGGYYLLGLSRPCLKLFEDVSWSSDQVFERTNQNAQALGYTLRILPSHYDIDTIDDVKTLIGDLEKDGQKAPTTKKYLTNLMKQKELHSFA